jgi:serine/threonine-protein kinase HipA
MQILDVYLDGQPQPAGRLTCLDSRSTQFLYAEDYLAKDGALPLSLSLPLVPEAFGDVAARAFFENLLPENDQMRRVMDQNRIDRGDFVALLAHLGADCPGAISCVPAGAGPVKNPGVFLTDYDALDLQSVADFVRRMAHGLALPDEVRDPSPVAGVQQKMAISRLPDGAFALPRPGTGAPTTHILKTPQVRDQRDAMLERTAAILARRAGLSVVVPDVLAFGEHPAMLIERYDRIVADGVVHRLHQEDFAQALGLPASLKYERNGNAERSFNAAGIHRLLLQTAAPVQAIREFLKLTLFNACVGNADNHAKNHSLIYSGGAAPHLAPAYDLLPTRLDPNLVSDMGFRIGTAAAATDIEVMDIALLLNTFGFSQAAAVRFATAEIAPLMLALDDAAANRALVPKDLDDLIGSNLEILSAACGLELDLRDHDPFQTLGGGWLSGS